MALALVLAMSQHLLVLTLVPIFELILMLAHILILALACLDSGAGASDFLHLFRESARSILKNEQLR